VLLFIANLDASIQGGRGNLLGLLFPLNLEVPPIIPPPPPVVGTGGTAEINIQDFKFGRVTIADFRASRIDIRFHS
jgi:hypothetical protein